MTVHFAAARTPEGSPVARALSRRAIGKPANDNGPGDLRNAGGRNVLSAALRHYVRHGEAAAREAAAQARRARLAGDAGAYRWWASICQTLDRRCAAELVQETSAPKAAS
ncbi:hypothetical protein HME9302_01449 [Alteripontixanthobacter maritimus]|uniref:Uncharacterized protein n=1 Tax=Alteripontixanthobacter maritimus TaxID=2161824 RepID=A0A369QD85_9SPHN|nr:hypothetical protein [Alteripontixanthobacter maritimus]RDC60248.1 hypothetical protein HME9302_01449 [Alteripontixanthobacter maritimus]